MQHIHVDKVMSVERVFVYLRLVHKCALTKCSSDQHEALETQQRQAAPLRSLNQEFYEESVKAGPFSFVHNSTDVLCLSSDWDGRKELQGLDLRDAAARKVGALFRAHVHERFDDIPCVVYCKAVFSERIANSAGRESVS